MEHAYSRYAAETGSGRAFCAATRANIGKRLAIQLDGEIISLDETGLHRTASELRKEDGGRESVIGGAASRAWRLSPSSATSRRP